MDRIGVQRPGALPSPALAIWRYLCTLTLCVPLTDLIVRSDAQPNPHKYTPTKTKDARAALHTLQYLAQRLLDSYMLIEGGDWHLPWLCYVWLPAALLWVETLRLYFIAGGGMGGGDDARKRID